MQRIIQMRNVILGLLIRCFQTVPQSAPPILPLSDAEILQNAGLLPAATPTPPANRPPVAQADAFNLARNMPLRIRVTQLLANDSDPDGDRLSVVGGTLPRFGTVTPDADGGGGVYTPRPGFVGSDSFSYTIGDGRGGSATATVTLTVH